LNIKQKDLAKAMNISAGYLSSIESGNSNASVDFLYHLSAKFKISLDYLFHGTGEMFLQAIPQPPEPAPPGKDFINDIETLDDLVWLTEHSPMFKNTLMGFAAKYFYENENNIKRNIEKSKKKKEINDE
jgi:transcriptional regulator with XRE-family HTH domain